MYTYKAEYRSNYDGDTIRFDIDLGFGVILSNQIIRLRGVDTPEMRGSELDAAKEARDIVRAKLLNAEEIILRTYKDRKGKYGRWIADVDVDGENLNAFLLANGFAEVF